MGWVKLDDHYTDHPKILGLSDRAFRLHVRAICYANSHLTDGALPAAFWKGQESARDELAGAGLLDADEPAGFRLHDYGDYQPRREDVLAERESARERMRRVRHSFGGSSAEHLEKFERSSSNPVPVPVPVPVEPEKEGQPRFAPPQVEDVRKHAAGLGWDGFDAEAFVAFYESKGWKVGKSPMRSWKAAMVTWRKRDASRSVAPVQHIPLTPKNTPGVFAPKEDWGPSSSEELAHQGVDVELLERLRRENG